MIRIPFALLLALLAVPLSPMTGGTRGTREPLQERPTVDTARASATDLVRRVRVPATVLADEEAELVPHVTGTVAAVNARVGDWVESGSVLVALDVPLLAQDIARAEAALAAAEARVGEEEAEIAARLSGLGPLQADYVAAKAEQVRRDERLARLEALRESNEATDAEVDEAREAASVAAARLTAAEAANHAADAEVKAALARAERARADLALQRAERERVAALARLAEIRSPFPRALVVARHCDTGALARKDTTPLLRLANVERVRVRLDVDEHDALNASEESRVVLTPTSPGVAPREGRVARVAGVLDPATRTMSLEVDLDNADHAWRPGLPVVADLEVFRRAGVLAVPAGALRVEGAERVVFVVRDGRLERRAITAGVDDGRRVEILSGLSAGAEVVVSGPDALSDGMAVRARPLSKD